MTEEQEQEDKNKRIRPRERARGQKTYAVLEVWVKAQQQTPAIMTG